MSDPATLDSIQAALTAALQPLLNSNATPPGTGNFAFGGFFAGPPSQEALANATGGASPAFLLALESDLPIAERTVTTTVLGLAAYDSRSIWRVYVIVNDARDDAGALTQAPTVPTLIQNVKLSLTGLAIEGLGDDPVVKYLGAQEARIERGVLYAEVLRFAADYPSDEIDLPVAGVPFTEFDGFFNLIDDNDGFFSENPIASTASFLAIIQDQLLSAFSLPIAQRPAASGQPPNTIFIATDAEYAAICVQNPTLGVLIWWPLTNPGLYAYGTASGAGTTAKRFAALSGGTVTTATVAGQTIGCVAAAAGAGAPVLYGAVGVQTVDFGGASPLARGSLVMTDSSGKAIQWTAGNFQAGILMADAHVGDSVPVMLLT